MIIPLPCRFGEIAECNGKELPLKGVTWFKWAEGMEYTYFFEKNNKWDDTDFYTTFEYNPVCSFQIPDSFLRDTFIREHGYPLKGRGFAYGVKFVNGKTYIEFIVTSKYHCHISVECDEKGKYIPDGDILFPIGWDTEKREDAILKSFKRTAAGKEKQPVKKKVGPIQLTLNLLDDV